MKVGDKVPVFIGGHTVAQAEVKAVDSSENTATLVVPATLVVMGVRTELTDLPGSEPATDTLITGVDRAGTEPVESATGSDTPANSETVTTESSGAQQVTVTSQEATPPATEPETSTDPAPVVEPQNPGTNVETPPVTEPAPASE